MKSSFPGKSALLYGLAYALLILVYGSGVDAPVARFQGVFYSVDDLRAFLRFEDAKAQSGLFYRIVKGNCILQTFNHKAPPKTSIFVKIICYNYPFYPDLSRSQAA